MIEGKTTERTIVTTDDILRILCNSVQSVLSSTAANAITYSPMIQEIEKTCLKPDIGCFVLFGGDFSGLVIVNFTKEAAMEIYHNYMVGMGMPEEELARSHTSDEVANSLGESLNQCIGRFRVDLENETSIFVSHNQPKMMVVSEAVQIAIEAKIEKKLLRQVSFKTGNGNRFYLEVALGKIKFYSLFTFKRTEDASIEDMMSKEKNQD
jgi:CheY-specific phosphatase CheX